MAPFLWRLIQSVFAPSRTLRSLGGWAVFAFSGAVLLLCPAAARADVYYINVYNVTFQGPCVGGGTCTETVVHASGYFDPVLKEAWDISVPLTGTVNVTFAYGTPPVCTATACLTTPVLYDPNASPGLNPIELSFGFPNFNAPVSTPLDQGGTDLFFPFLCGGESGCNTSNALLGTGASDFEAISGTYTSVDVGPDPTPEPGSFVLLATGALGLVSSLRLGRAPAKAS